MPYELSFDTRRVGMYAYAALRVRGMPTTVLDFWHKAPDDEPFISGNVAMDRFKNGREAVVVAFERAIGTIAVDFAQVPLDYIVPLIKSRAEAAGPDSPVGRIATAASNRLGVPLNVDIFRQTPRRRLHGGEFLSYDQRYDIVHPNLRVVGRHRGVRILLVDDVVSSGATTSAYRDRFADAGGEVYAVLGVMKYAQEQPLLNPALYPPLAR